MAYKYWKKIEWTLIVIFALVILCIVVIYLPKKTKENFAVYPDNSTSSGTLNPILINFCRGKIGRAHV